MKHYLAASVLLLPCAAPALPLTYDMVRSGPYDARILTVNVSQVYENENAVLYARLYWWWCYADYIDSAQVRAPRFDSLQLDHHETQGGWGWAELWNQRIDGPFELDGTVRGSVTLSAQLPWIPFTLEVWSLNGVHESWTVNMAAVPLAPVPEPAVGLLTALGLAVLAWWKRGVA